MGLGISSDDSCLLRRRRPGSAPDMAQQVRYAIGCFSPLGDAVHVERLGHRESDGQARIKRRKGILKYHLDFAPERTNLFGWNPRDVAPAELDASSIDVDQAQQRTAGRRFSAA